MESTIDLILKGHFDSIKEQIDNTKIRKQRMLELQETMQKVLAFLERQKSREAIDLKNSLLELLPAITGSNEKSILKSGKRPMQKAGKKPKDNVSKKAM